MLLNIPLTICLFMLSIFSMHKIMNHVARIVVGDAVYVDMANAVVLAVSDAPSV